jgi:hypothetical protein
MPLLFAGLFVLNHAMAQDSVRRQLIYANVIGQFGSLAGGKFSGAAILGRHHEISIGYELYGQDARNKPDDFLCSNCNQVPDKDRISGGTISYGYVLYPDFLKGFSRVILRTGILIGKQGIPDEFKEVSIPKPPINNYSYHYEEHFAMAWIINPTLDIALGRVLGFTIGPFGVFNQDFAGGGISFGLLLGSVAKEKAAVHGHSKKPQEAAPGNLK